MVCGCRCPALCMQLHQEAVLLPWGHCLHPSALGNRLPQPTGHGHLLQPRTASLQHLQGIPAWLGSPSLLGTPSWSEISPLVPSPLGVGVSTGKPLSSGD